MIDAYDYTYELHDYYDSYNLDDELLNHFDYH